MVLHEAERPPVPVDEQRLRTEIDAARARTAAAEARATASREAMDADLEALAADAVAELERLDTEHRRRLEALGRATDAEVARLQADRPGASTR